MSFSITKNPDSDLDYSIDWSQWLTGAETIASSVWSVNPNDMAAHDEGMDSARKIATTWLQGGSPIQGKYSVTNTITTNSTPPRQEKRVIQVTVSDSYNG